MKQRGIIEQGRDSESGWEANSSAVPPANIYVRNDEYVIELEMPGVTRDRLEISLEGNELAVRGTPADEQTPGQLIYSETNHCGFHRSFELSTDVDHSRIRADLNQGIVCVYLPQARRMKPRKIRIE